MPRWAYTLAGGALGGLAVWWFASRAIDAQFDKSVGDLDRQLTAGGGELNARLAAGRRELITEVQQQIAAQVPPTVRDEVRGTLAQHGITPATGHQIARLATVSDTLLNIALSAR